MKDRNWTQVVTVGLALAVGFALGIVSVVALQRSGGEGCPVSESARVYKTPGKETGTVYSCDYSVIVAIDDEIYLVPHYFEGVAVLSGGPRPSGKEAFRPGGRKVVPEGAEPGYANYKSNLERTPTGYTFTSVKGGQVHVVWSSR